MLGSFSSWNRVWMMSKARQRQGSGLLGINLIASSIFYLHSFGAFLYMFITIWLYPFDKFRDVSISNSSHSCPQALYYFYAFQLLDQHSYPKPLQRWTKGFKNLYLSCQHLCFNPLYLPLNVGKAKRVQKVDIPSLYFFFIKNKLPSKNNLQSFKAYLSTSTLSALLRI